MSDILLYVTCCLVCLFFFKAGIFAEKKHLDGCVAGNLIVVEDPDGGPLLFLEVLDPSKLSEEYVELKVRKKHSPSNDKDCRLIFEKGE